MSQRATRLEAHIAASRLKVLIDKMDPFMEAIELVKDFNNAFELEMLPKSEVGDEKNYTLKHTMMAEELSEYLEACKKGDYVEVCDAVVDMMYILLGIVTHHKMESFFFSMFEEVHQSNMSKLENGRVLRRSDGKIMKGSDYFSPNLSVIILSGGKHE